VLDETTQVGGISRGAGLAPAQSQNCCVQKSPIGAQMPQLSLQQYVPLLQNEGPQNPAAVSSTDDDPVAGSRATSWTSLSCDSGLLVLVSTLAQAAIAMKTNDTAVHNVRISNLLAPGLQLKGLLRTRSQSCDTFDEGASMSAHSHQRAHARISARSPTAPYEIFAAGDGSIQDVMLDR
jgi:hypothetical protein